MGGAADQTSEKSLVLITGASGYLGGYVAKAVVEAGYPLRLTARPSKVEILRKEFGSDVDVVPVPDIVTGDYTEALQGVSTIVHLACPLPGLQGQEIAASEYLRFPVDGTMNLVRQGAAMGVKKIIICGSMLAVTDMDNMQDTFDSSHIYSHEDWNPATIENLLESHHHPWWVYGAAKTKAEQEVWKFAEEHPDIDFTTILPGFVYGPSIDIPIPPRGSREIPSTPFIFYSNIFKLPFKTGFPLVPPLSVDIRDVARAHLLAISAPPDVDNRRKRLPLCAPSFTWAQAVEHLRKVRPELGGRLLEESEIAKVYPDHDGVAQVDCSRTKEVLEGFGEFIPWQKTVEDCVDDLLVVEKGWSFE